MLLSSSNIPYRELEEYFPDIFCDVQENRPYLMDGEFYLWKKEYDIQKFLGVSVSGHIFKCIDEKGAPKTVKIVDNNTIHPLIEAATAKDLYELFNKDGHIDEQEMKYLNLTKVNEEAKDGEYGFPLESAPAEDNLYNDLETKREKLNDRLQPLDNKAKTIDSVLRKAIQALKSTISLHNKGYSHNNITLESFLKINNWNGQKGTEDLHEKLNEKDSEIQSILQIENTKEKFKKICDFLTENAIKTPKIEKIISEVNPIKDSLYSFENEKQIEQKVGEMVSIINNMKDKKLHKNRIQLADFALVTKIPEGEYGEFPFYSPEEYYPSSDSFCYGENEISKNRIIKHDVFALGRVFQYLLFRINYFIDDMPRMVLLGSDLNKIKENKEIYGEITCQYTGEAKYTENEDEFKNFNGYKEGNKTGWMYDYYERIAKFMSVIIRILEDEYQKRITLEEALEEIKK